MLTQKLDIKDLQFEKMQPFDGTMAYAQNKRQQVVMTAEYAKQYPKVHFSSMHPGWADTPGEHEFGYFLNKSNRWLKIHEGVADYDVTTTIALHVLCIR